MRILIGIPSCRRPEGLKNLLASLRAQTDIDGISIEAFVADNDPEKREASQLCEVLAERFRWPLTCEIVEEAGISAARNAILEQARKRGVDFVAMLDDDEVADPKWLSELLRVQRATDADVVGGPVHRHFVEPSLAVQKSGVFPAHRASEGIIREINATGNILLNCETLARLDWPLFDQSFGLTGGEDREYFTRLRKRNTRFAWSPGAQATEELPPERLTARAVVRRAFRIGNSDMRILQAHGTPSDVANSLAKGAAILVAAPILSPLLLWPSRRLWILAKWWRSIGKVTALLGRRFQDYARRDGMSP